MTVEQLIKHLLELPRDAVVLYEDGDYKDSLARVREIDYQKTGFWGREGNSVVIR